MNISGSGTIAAGEYNEKISVSGSGKISGNIRCIALSCSGSVKGEGSVDCAEDVKVSGSCHIGGSLTAKNISASGSMKVGGDVSADGEMGASGSVKVGGSIKCSTLKCSGGADVDKEISAEEIHISGYVKCSGLMNAEKIDIDMGNSSVTSTVGSIGGSEIKVKNCNGGKLISRMPLLKRIVDGSGKLRVDELIEGDVIALEYVTAPKVAGRIVAIGAGCDIDLVQYSEEVEVHPDAKVKNCEKI
jgi:cytoskeletal protein CcmA (bactofilin family)